jgi:hypothetical protein
MRPDGRFSSYFGSVWCDAREPASGLQLGDTIRVPRVLFDATGTVVDTLGWESSPPPRVYSGEPLSRPEPVRTASGTYAVPTPPTSRPEWHQLHDGRIVVDVPYADGASDTATFTVTRLDLAEDTVYSRTFPYVPESYGEAELDSVAVQRANQGAGMMYGMPAATPPDADVVARQLRASMDWPAFRLPIQDSWLAEDEGLWLKRQDGPRALMDRWIVLDAEGVPRGQVELPPGTRVLWSRGDTFWAVELDEFDVPWLVRYRIEG